MNRTCVRLLVALLAALALNSAAAQTIYRSIDENGNVVFSDTNPDGDAVPVKLRELSVVQPGKLDEGRADAEGSEAADQGDESDPTADVNLRIVSPQPDETIQNTGYVLSVQVEAGALPEGARLAYLVDGQVKQTSRSTSVRLEQVFRGEHRLAVELRDAAGRVVANAGPVTFHMRQTSNPN